MHEGVEHPATRFGLVGMLVARWPRPRRAGGPLERRAEEHEVPVVAGDDESSIDEATEGTGGAVDRQRRGLHHPGSSSGAERQRGDDEPAVVVGQQTDERRRVQLGDHRRSVAGVDVDRAEELLVGGRTGGRSP